MRERLQRLLPFLILVLLVFSSICPAQAQDTFSKSSTSAASTITNDALSADKLEPSSAQKLPHERQHGAEATAQAGAWVDRALSQLRQIDQQSSNHPRSPGIFGALLHLAKELLPHVYTSAPGSSTLGSQSKDAVELLERAAKSNNPDAIYLLAQINFYGNFTHPKNHTEAFQRYMELASLNGNSSAQHMVGFMYATGIGGAVERDQAKALLYHTFAAQAGHTRSEMTVAFRHHSGIGTFRNCEEAALYYKRVADKAIKWYRAGPPGGRAWVPDSYRLADDNGGVYGEGASVSSAGSNALKGGVNSDAHAALDDVLEYLDLMSSKGDFKATFSLGRIHYDGQKGLPRDLKAAKRYFQIVAGQYWKKDGSTVDVSDRPSLEKYACKAAGSLGRMFLRGEGVDQNFKKAIKWFQRGIKAGDAGAQNGLGIMYLHGLGVPKNVMKATDYFKAAADQDFSPAQVNLGALHLDQGKPEDIQIASRYFELAARYGHIEAFYYLAELVKQGIGREPSCGLATSYYKIVTEKAESLLTSFAEANQAYADGDKELALVDYMMAAEQGYEKGQANVAYLLDREKSMLTLPSISPFHKPRSSLLHNTALALIYWTRSAKQSNIDSMVKMGDYYLNGIGTQADMEKAAACYTAASDFHQSAQALYNLGWMHENGVGLTQDFHLAKRYYDQALETNEEAYLPVTLSLLKLRVRSAWNTITHGRINSIRDEPVVKKQWSMKEWISNFLRDDPHYDGLYEDDYDDDILSHNDPIPGGDDGFYDEVDDGLLETVVIIGIVAALIWFIYYRQQLQQAHRRQQEAAAAQQAGQPLPVQPQVDEGFFPPVGDPAFPGWAAGGIGH